MNCLCKTCGNRAADYEIGIDIEIPNNPPVSRTWLICSLNKEGFPWREECEDYERRSQNINIDN